MDGLIRDNPMKIVKMDDFLGLPGVPHLCCTPIWGIVKLPLGLGKVIPLHNPGALCPFKDHPVKQFHPNSNS